MVVGTIHRKGPRPADGHRLELTEVKFSSDPPDREAEVVRLTAACTAVLEDAIRRDLRGVMVVEMVSNISAMLPPVLSGFAPQRIVIGASPS